VAAQFSGRRVVLFRIATEDANVGALIEHHQADMAHADWIIDLGPGAGHDGGRIVFEGTPADLVAARSTLTGEHLAAYVST
jgi:excinuclease UvrABC ATPase subunit